MKKHPVDILKDFIKLDPKLEAYFRKFCDEKVRIVWICPTCGYYLDDVLRRHAIHDYPCPRCETKRLSDFIKIEEREEE